MTNGRLLSLALLLAAACTTTPTNPLTTYALATPEAFDAHVLERLPAGAYLYLRVQQAGEPPTWVATLRHTAFAGDDVHLTVLARADHFTSARLGRDFSPLSFATVTPQSPRSSP